ASDGRIAEAEALAARLVAAGVQNTPAALTLALEAAKREDWTEARRQLAALPRDGLSAFIVPLLEAWVVLEAEGVDQALAITDTRTDVRGLEPVRGIQAGLIAERGNRHDLARAAFASALEVAENPPFRMVEIIGNYHQRNGRPEEAAALYRRYAEANPG